MSALTLGFLFLLSAPEHTGPPLFCQEDQVRSYRCQNSRPRHDSLHNQSLQCCIVCTVRLNTASIRLLLGTLNYSIHDRAQSAVQLRLASMLEPSSFDSKNCLCTIDSAPYSAERPISCRRPERQDFARQLHCNPQGPNAHIVIPITSGSDNLDCQPTLTH